MNCKWSKLCVLLRQLSKFWKWNRELFYLTQSPDVWFNFISRMERLNSHLVVYYPIEIHELKKRNIKTPKSNTKKKESVINALWRFECVLYVSNVFTFPNVRMMWVSLSRGEKILLTHFLTHLNKKEESKNTEKKFHDAFVTVFWFTAVFNNR